MYFFIFWRFRRLRFQLAPAAWAPPLRDLQINWHGSVSDTRYLIQSRVNSIQGYRIWGWLLLPEVRTGLRKSPWKQFLTYVHAAGAEAMYDKTFPKGKVSSMSPAKGTTYDQSVWLLISTEPAFPFNEGWFLKSNCLCLFFIRKIFFGNFFA